MKKTLLLAALVAVGLTARAQAATVSGTIFRDVNADGQYNNTGVTAEPAIGGVTLNAVDELGNSTSTTSNAATGAYSITLPGNQLRIEAVTTLRLSPGASGFALPTPHTSVLFTTGNQTARDIAFANPQQFCQDAPTVAANVYSNGNPNSTGTAGTNSWMVRAPFNFTPDNNPAHATIVNGQIIGSTFGLVYQRSTDSLFASAFLKRHSGLGIGDGNPAVAANDNTDETGAIYRIANPNAATPVASLLIDLQAFGINTGSVTRVENTGTADFEAPPSTATSPNIDADAFDKVGKVGLGAMTLSEDERTLWVVNLNDRNLYQIPLTITGGVPTANGAGIIAHNVGASAAAPACANGVFRPFAVKEMDGFVYVGGVCTAETAGTAADLRVAVLRHDPLAAPGSFTSMLNVPLNYTRGAVSDDGTTPTSAVWRPWRATWAAITAPAPGAGTYGQTIQPQPILSDIEFDTDGSMVLSFIDRLSHQAGNGNYSSLAADGSPRNTYEGAAGGETLLVCFSGGTYTLESAGGCGTRFSDATTGGQGPGSGEFFWHDKYQGGTYPPDQVINVGAHREITLGGAAIHAVRREMVSSVFDPRTAFRAAGYRVFNLVDFDITAANSAGETARSVEIFGQDADGGLPVRFGKAAGIGNVELMCSPPPIEIGNRVWFDTNRNGVQDPAETPLANVALTLYSAGGAVLGRTVTSATGEWYFSFAVGATDASTADNNVILPNPFFANYFVAIDAANFNAGQPLFGRTRTLRDADVTANGDARDSDGNAVAIPTVGTLTAFAFTTGGPGANDHTIDFGFAPPDFGDLPDTTAGTGAGDYQTLLANNGPFHPVVPGLFLGAGVDSEADGFPGAAATGDDLNNTDDEDGVTAASLITLQRLVAGGANVITLNATNTTGAAAQLCGFVDFNANGVFTDAGETQTVAVPNGTNNGSFNLTFTPPAAQSGARFARFRLSTDATPCGANGAATDGEVEDYTARIARVDFGDLPDSSAATGSLNYDTDRAFAFVGHDISTTATTLFMGTSVDAEANGTQTLAANGDDNDVVPDDEDGLQAASFTQIRNTPGIFLVTVTNNVAATPANLCGYADWNDDGDFADVNETASAVVPTGTTGGTATLNFGTIPAGAFGLRYARLRLTTSTCAVALPTDSALVDGEVEDYRFNVAALELGDLPDTGAGIGPGNYSTLLADNGASHVRVSGVVIGFGASVDTELDGQPTVAASGDDIAGIDDEDGITIADLALTVGVAPQVRFNVTNQAGTAGRACGFIDFNGDGDFADAGESVAFPVPNGTTGTNAVFPFPNPVPAGSAPNTYARFRVSTDLVGACNPVGQQPNGEVEDYPVTITVNTDYGDLPDSGPGVGANNYETLIASGGAAHPVVSGLQLGATIDFEPNGQPNATATGDGADEDGINVANLALTQNVAPVVNLTATNTVGVAARVCGFIDYNADGDFADAGESANAAVPNGSNNAPFVLNFGVVPTGAAANSFARFRLSTDTAGACAPNGTATDGEVEDYAVTIASNNDFGDLPDTGPGVGANNYETLTASGGAFHPIVAGLRFGATVDAEPDGQPNAGATGDGADEDGVTLTGLTQNVAPAINFTATNTTGTAARACGFIDYNGDGDFADAGESANVAVPTGSNNAPFVLNFGVVPVGSAANTFARFRLSTDTAGACAPNGAATNGEVEDYAVTIASNNDFGDLPDTGPGVGANNYETLTASGGAFHPIVVGLRLGATVDNEADGQPNATASGDGADEDGINVANLSLTQNVAPVVNLTATNTTGTAARVCGFVDYNADGDFADAGESANVAVPTGSNNAAFALNFGVVPTGSAANTFARFRVSTDTAGACAPNGAATNGEVEDYVVTIGANNDFGDLPDTGAGVGPNNYETLNASGGALHPIVAGLRLGATIDNEVDGQPSAGATGDGADEDGINVADLNLTVGTAAVVNLTATNTTGTAARVCGFIDFNADGDFADAGESANVAVPTGSNNAALALNFGTVPFGSATSSFARFRISTDTAGACAPNGAATNGEVEDYTAGVAAPSDFGDLPDTGPGIGAGNYETASANGGPRHPQRTGLRLGATIDTEADGQPSTAANGDGADEDGVTLADLAFTAGAAANVRVSATNTTSTAARVCGFVDFNADGDFADAGEAAQVAVPDGSNNVTLTLAFGTVPANVAASSYARFRLSTATTPCSDTGAELDGEVEDYTITGSSFDLGDLPDGAAGVGAGNYQTLVADGGARHQIVPGIRLGATIDAEADGQPDVGATGDGADEDGVTFPVGGFNLGSPARAQIVASNSAGTPALACGFIDWNGDGDFLDASETAQIAVPAGANNAALTLDFGNAPTTVAATIYGRFRISTGGACAPAGNANDGEVEDYVVPTTGTGALSLGDLVWEDVNNNGLADGTEPGIPGVPVAIYRDDNQDCAPDGAAVSTQTTTATGNYLFTNLLPGNYVVEITPPTIYLGSTGTGRYAPTGPYEPGPDPDNDVNNDDNGTNVSATVIRTCAVQLTAKAEPTNDGDADNNTNLTVDFGLVRDFDLALRKTLSPGQDAIVRVGDTVSFTITVYNQGRIPATNIQIMDYIPAGMVLNDPAWTAAGANATRTIAGPIAAGTSVNVTIALRITTSTTAGYRNIAEISTSQDDTGTTRPDIDSIPDTNNGNDGPPTDDEINNNNNDEDDADYAIVQIAAAVPTLSAGALIVLMIAMMMIVARRKRLAR